MREGLIPTVLGTAVTATGVAMRGYDMKKRGMTKRDTTVAIGAGILGFGLAHVVLGSIDLFQKQIDGVLKSAPHIYFTIQLNNIDYNSAYELMKALLGIL